jgi:hypothetical protein
VKEMRGMNKDIIHEELMNRESWEGIYLSNNLNESYFLFLNRFLGYFRRAFPKNMIKKVDKNSNWIT